jgi:hypothetical protein
MRTTVAHICSNSFMSECVAKAALAACAVLGGARFIADGIYDVEEEWYHLILEGYCEGPVRGKVIHQVLHTKHLDAAMFWGESLYEN